MFLVTLQIFRNVQPGVPRHIPHVDLSDKVDSTLVTALMPFQTEGVCFGISRDGRCLIGDDMGLGKSIQALGIAHYYYREWPLLIVCPSSMRYIAYNNMHNNLLNWCKNDKERNIIDCLLFVSGMLGEIPFGTGYHQSPQAPYR